VVNAIYVGRSKLNGWCTLWSPSVVTTRTTKSAAKKRGKDDELRENNICVSFETSITCSFIRISECSNPTLLSPDCTGAHVTMHRVPSTAHLGLLL
jgi:hypothetical protein